MKIAVIGSGISGLYAAWQLSRQHDVTVFEKNDYWGGHTDTHLLDIDGQLIAVDSGFIVFNTLNYPTFCNMLAQLGVPHQASNMSFSVNNRVSGLQYNPSQKWSLLKKPGNFLKRDFRLMLRDLLRFYAEGRQMDANQIDPAVSLEQYLDQHHYSVAFRDEHLYPMCGALWSTDMHDIGRIPLRFVISFFQHHRMLQVDERPQWLTVQGGSSQYIQAIRQQAKHISWQHARVHRVVRDDAHVNLLTSNGMQQFDWVVFASHADDTLRLLDKPSIAECAVLGAFNYSDNLMVVHRDASIMPRAKSQWASWHVHVNRNQHTETSYSFSYWMNRLQNLPCKTDILATLNPNLPIAEDKVLVSRHYRHPQFDSAAIQAQQQWATINGKQRSSFCGAYWGWGFHEDGARSAERVVNALAVSIDAQVPA